MKRKLLPKERTIYNNYNLWETYPDELIAEYLREDGRIEEDEEPSDEELMEERYHLDELDWDYTKSELESFFKNGNKWLIVGSVGRWDGLYSGGFVFDTFEEMFYKATKDCAYIHFYDENGHLYLSCSHHDGSCSFEIKEITDKGIEYLERWEDNWNDKRSEKYIHTQIFNRYSRLPQFAHKVYGRKKFEYEPQSKERFIQILNNQAKSFY